MALKDYVKEMRLINSIYLLEIILGALIAINFKILSLDFIKLIVICVSFQILYSAIYILNDIIDYPYDKLNPKKQKRPVANGKINLKNALVFSFVLLVIAFSISIFTSKTLVYFEIFFLVYNIAYSLLFKKIPYLGSFIGGLTHSLRLIMGIILFGIFNQYYLAISLFLVSASYHFAKRLKEIEFNENVRHPNKYYSPRKIKTIWFIFGLIIPLLGLLSKGLEGFFVWVLFGVYILTIILYLKNKKIKKIFHKLLEI